MKDPSIKKNPDPMGKKVVKECLFELKIKNTYIIFYDPLLTKSSNLLLNNTYEIFTCSYLKNV